MLVHHGKSMKKSKIRHSGECGSAFAVRQVRLGLTPELAAIMTGDAKDWLRVVYGRGLEPESGARDRPGRMEIFVRHVPPELEPPESPGEQRVRLTVAPSDRRQGWTLWLRDDAPMSRAPARRRIWWRVDPGTWQPLTGSGDCVAEGRGRIRLDVSLRLEGIPATPPRLRFVAEPASSAV